MDTLNRGVHFPVITSAHDMAWKAVAVNLSDLAAMGAEPLYCTVHLCHDGNDDFLNDFTRGCEHISATFELPYTLASAASTDMSVTVQVYGQVPANQALRRDGARAGDGLYVSGHPGDAALALSDLALSKHHRQYVQQRLDKPFPRVLLGQQLRGIANAMIDVSDGLLADLGHILAASGVGARVRVDRLPLSATLQSLHDKHGARRLALTGGDDYELCFTVPADREPELQQLHTNVTITRIGDISAEERLLLLDDDNRPVSLDVAGYEHFREGRHGK
jgi:thiamine-monophosphate kinase